jgi:glucose-1-phosphate thymidylyltransferase
VKAIVLAAGYATRLQPLTDSVAKPLLPLAGRPMLDYLYDKIAAVEEIDELHVVTNSRFAADFHRWAAERERPLPLVVQDDGTRSNEDRLGAIGDVRFVIERGGLAGEDLLVVAGDNLFDFDLRDLVAFWKAKSDGSAIGVHDVGDLDLMRQYSMARLDEDDRVTLMVEKPEQPTSTLAGIAVYVYRAEHAALLDDYLAEGNSPDQPGRFAVWLSSRAPLYGYRFPGDWLDIGDRDQLLDADNRLREAAGKPRRDEYTLEK